MLDDLSIRIADSRDVEALAHSNMALALETENIKLSLPVVTKGVRTLLETPQHGFYTVAELNNRFAGCVMVTFEWSDWRCGLFWWLQSIYIMPEFRRKSVFGKLYEFLDEKASQQQNVCGFRLYVEKNNNAAQSTYAKVGMREAAYKFYQTSYSLTTAAEPVS
jgi:ribosomal protein S18 acetylase RimI-like enzyme